jgi:hypothetical protein
VEEQVALTLLALEALAVEEVQVYQELQTLVEAVAGDALLLVLVLEELEVLVLLFYQYQLHIILV